MTSFKEEEKPFHKKKKQKKRKRERRICNGHTSISIARKMAGPLHVRVTFVLAGGDGEAADGREDGGVAEGRLGGDDAVGDVVFDGLEMISAPMISAPMMMMKFLI